MSRLTSNYSKYQQPKGIKIVVVGPSGVGKTSLSNRFVRDQFSGRVPATMGAAFSQKLFQYQEGKHLKMQLWDTAGQQKYRSIAKIYYQDAKAAILVYDVTNKESFQTMKGWAQEVIGTAPKNIVLAVVGNKTDLMPQDEESQSSLKYSEVKKYASHIGALFHLVSAKNSKGIKILFEELAQKVSKIQQKIDNKAKKLQNQSKNKKKGTCCA